ncbi:unnamed protein product [Cyclocybe aegerita]|uniref:Fe2OG dioxygenase domain-containing protein n=1 Tax=Cyclocybe aegerita TaxID=1973307 RepID=A0A8S0VWZ5_CYCAE|nr:unnamed protein product [Cyclocybe aegerita]
MKDMSDCEVYYVPSFISEKKAEDWYEELLSLETWYQPKLKVYGREVIQSRKIAAYATDPNLTLKYSGQVVDMNYEYPQVLREIQDQVEDKLGVKFNHVMLNLYEDGTIYIGNHRDTPENKVIASVSLGAPRTFIMTQDPKAQRRKADHASPSSVGNVELRDLTSRPRTSPRSESSSSRKCPADYQETESTEEPPQLFVARKSWILAPGSLVVMQGETQKYWKHEIPKEPKVKEGRISLTFRQLVVVS